MGRTLAASGAPVKLENFTDPVPIMNGASFAQGEAAISGTAYIWLSGAETPSAANGTWERRTA